MQNPTQRRPLWVRLATKSNPIAGVMPLGLLIHVWGLLRSDMEYVWPGVGLWIFGYVYSAANAAASTGRDDRRMAGALIAFGFTPWLALLAWADRGGPGPPLSAFLPAMVFSTAAMIVARIGIWRIPTLARQVFTRAGGVVFLLWIAAYIDVARRFLPQGSAAWLGIQDDLAFLCLTFGLPVLPFALWAGLRLLLAADSVPRPAPAAP